MELFIQEIESFLQFPDFLSKILFHNIILNLSQPKPTFENEKEFSGTGNGIISQILGHLINIFL